MKAEIIKVNPEEFGIAKKEGEELTKDLKVIKSERDIMSKKYSEIIKKEITVELSKEARKLRLLIANNRTKGVENWHKVNKQYFLKGGQFVDAIKNKEVAENKRMEDQLLSIEQHAEKVEQERIEKEQREEKERTDKLQAERVELIKDYIEDANDRDLSSMDSDVWDAYFSTKKRIHGEKIEAEKIEAARIEKEEKEAAEERERIEAENKKLRKEAEEKELKEAEEERKRNVDARLKKEADEKEAAKLKAENDAILKKAEDKRIKAEKELQDRKDKEQKAEADRLAKIQSDLNRGDAEKLKSLLSELDSIKTKYSFKSAKNIKKLKGTCELLDKVIKYIKE